MKEKIEVVECGGEAPPVVAVGGVVSTVIRLYRSDGQLEEFEVASEEAVLSVLRSACVRKLRRGEPFFVLRGQDESAADLVNSWINQNHSTLTTEKYHGALRLRDRMRAWPNRRRPT